MADSRINIWLGKELKEACKKLNINISKEFRNWLIEKLKTYNIEIKTNEPEIIVLVRCIHCGNEFETSSIIQVRCPKCQRSFRVYTSKGSRIRKLIKGNLITLHTLYNRYYKRR